MNTSAAQTGSTMRTEAQSIVSVSLSSVQKLVPWVSALVVALGVFREVYISHFGMETVLQGLRHISLDAETTLAAWYSSQIMTACAVALILAGLLNRARGQSVGMTWFLLAAIFFALSLDESAAFHEEVGSRLQAMLNTGGILYFAWVIPGSIFVAITGLYFIPFLLKLPRKTALGFFTAGTLFVSGAIGMELIGGYLAEGVEERGWQYYLAATTEETLEISGLTLFLWSLLDYIKRQQEFWRVT